MGFGESATIKKVGIIKVDEENQMFQIKGAISNNGKKSQNYIKRIFDCARRSKQPFSNFRYHST